MFRRLIAVALGLACVSAAPSGFSPGHRAEAVKQAAAARRVLDKHLLDYTTTRFQDVYAVRSAETGAVWFCGQLNSKNRMGAYTGWTDFLVTVPFNGGNGFVEASGTADIIRPTACNKAGPNPIDVKDYSADLTYR